ncbi:MAG TPA: choice-of-anchor B family protein [Longimicrobiales bacterium]|nr:choice-of-anchor B family protein [Longimicrobiales bacterium]
MLRTALPLALALAIPAAAAAAGPSAGTPDAPVAPVPAVPSPASVSAAYAGFGSAVAVSGNRVFVGNPGAFAFFPMPPNRPGIVNVFRVDPDGTWTEVATVDSPTGQVGDAFGSAVAVNDSWLAVGAPGAGDGAGAVVVYSRRGDVFTLLASLQGDAPAGAMGAALSLDGNLLHVGVPGDDDGAGSVQVLDLAAGGAAVVLRPADPIPGERFGAAVSGSGGELLVGAPGPGPDALGFGGPPRFLPGRAVLFAPQDGLLTQAAVLAPEGETPAAMGWSVILAGDHAFAGAPLAGSASGQVHHFTRTDEGWVPAGALASDAEGQAGLGMALAWSGEELLAGAPLQGFISVFTAGEDGTFTESQQLRGEAGQTFFGGALAARDDWAVAGAPGEALFSGVGYVLIRGVETWATLTTVVDETRGPVAITGEAVECAPDGTAAAFPCSDVDLVAFIPVQDLGAERGIMVNDVWGWTDERTGREYALVGRNDATVFVDITDAANPAVLGALPLSDAAVVSLWRDMKVYADHAFIVADAAGAHGIQVFDLRQLRGLSPDPDRLFQETARYDGIFSAHNIVLNEDTGFAYVVGASMGGTTCGGGLHMVDVRDPANPVFAGCFQDSTTGLAGTGYSHDAQCVLYRGPDADYAGREICFGANENALSIADVTDKENPVAVATARYPNSAYLHQGWVSRDQRYFFMNDEGDEIAGTTPRTRTLVWDIQDLDDPVLVTEHLGTTAASDHNLYVRDNLMYQSNYVSGLRILDVSDPANPVEVGYFDTVPQGGNDPGFAGSWSNYPFFPSGSIIVTSMREGLFVLKRKERRAVL